jgi:hypothetical protein
MPSPINMRLSAFDYRVDDVFHVCAKNWYNPFICNPVYWRDCMRAILLSNTWRVWSRTCSASHLKIVGDWKIDRLDQVGERWRAMCVDSVPILLHIFGIRIARKHGAAVHVQHNVSSPRCIA